MAAQRLWPTVHALGRTFICNNRSEILNQSVWASRPSHQNTNGNNFKANFKQNLFKVGKGSYVKVISRQLSSGTYHFYREFNEGENEHAHDILCSIPAYDATTLNFKNLSEAVNINGVDYALLDKNWLLADSEDLVRTLENVSKNESKLEDKKLSVLCSSLCGRVAQLNDDQILNLLSSLSRLCNSNASISPSIAALKNSLDNTCAQRVRSWDISKLFLVADHWYALGISRSSIYFSKLLQAIGGNVYELTPSQFVQFMFYANINRGFESIKLKSLILSIKNSLKDISIEELGIITMGLFKTQTIIKDDTLNREIIKKLIENINTISNHSLGSILKFLNKSLPGNAESQCFELLQQLHPHLNRFNNLVLLQAALLGNNLLVFHEGVIETVGKRFGASMSELRLKDIERFTYVLMLYKFLPSSCPDILVRVINELRKQERLVEINHFPKCFVSCVNYLVTMGVFPLDLISASLQPSMLQLLQANSNDNMGRELNELNWSLKIEGPDFYPGYQLDPELSQNLTKKFLGRVPTKVSPNQTHQERFYLDVQNKLGTILGSDQYITGTLILPHFSNADLVFCTNREGAPMFIPPEYRLVAPENIKVALGRHEGLIWNAVMLGGRNSYLRNSTELRGNFAMKIRQLNQIGYRVTVIPYQNYTKRSIKYKLACLGKSLKESSSLNVEGRVEMAMATFKMASASLEDDLKIEEKRNG